MTQSYLRNRYYDPEIGRFITEDPARDGLNWYVYCNNDPVNCIDRSGLAPRPYQPELWNDGGDIQYSTNCYAYALDWRGQISYGNRKGEPLPMNSKPQPGDFMSDKPILLKNLYYSYYGKNRAAYALSGSMLDALGNNHVFRPATNDNIVGNNLGKNEWVVYLVATSGWDDYHWYRQNPDGTWSHKPGNTPVTNQELMSVTYNNVVVNPFGQIVSMDKPVYEYGDIITDPTAISRSIKTYYYDTDGTLIHSSILTYDRVVGAYVVGSK